MDSLVRYLATSLVDKPEEVQVTLVEGTDQNIVELRVAPEDLGKIIGKAGRIAKCLRTLVTTAAMKEGKNYNLEIID
jgi:predicted RNA-binding protein YlqC (UPF0109 family)